MTDGGSEIQDLFGDESEHESICKRQKTDNVKDDYRLKDEWEDDFADTLRNNMNNDRLSIPNSSKTNEDENNCDTIIKSPESSLLEKKSPNQSSNDMNSKQSSNGISKSDKHLKKSSPSLIDSNEKLKRPEKEISIGRDKVNTKEKPKVKSKLNKNEVGKYVVKLLTPAYAEKRFESRDLFKKLARNISHNLVDKDHLEIKKYIEEFLQKNPRITDETSL